MTSAASDSGTSSGPRTADDIPGLKQRIRVAAWTPDRARRVKCPMSGMRCSLLQIRLFSTWMSSALGLLHQALRRIEVDAGVVHVEVVVAIPPSARRHIVQALQRNRQRRRLSGRDADLVLQRQVFESLRERETSSCPAAGPLRNPRPCGSSDTRRPGPCDRTSANRRGTSFPSGAYARPSAAFRCTRAGAGLPVVVVQHPDMQLAHRPLVLQASRSSPAPCFPPNQ